MFTFSSRQHVIDAALLACLLAPYHLQAALPALAAQVEPAVRRTVAGIRLEREAAAGLDACHARAREAVSRLSRWLGDDEELACGCGVALHTPGHTPGSMSFWFADAKLLIAGDTLFRRGIGRTDLWGGDQRAIVRSIKERLYRLDEEAIVVTGHGPDTRLGDEMRENPFVRA